MWLKCLLQVIFDNLFESDEVKLNFDFRFNSTPYRAWPTAEGVTNRELLSYNNNTLAVLVIFTQFTKFSFAIIFHSILWMTEADVATSAGSRQASFVYIEAS